MDEPTNSTASRLRVALIYGGVCHLLFVLAFGAMIVAMATGMTWSHGAVPRPWNWVANTLLLLQFPLGHSLLLSAPGRKWLQKPAPGAFASDLAPTTYVIVASIQVLLLFAAWTPSEIIWWEAAGSWRVGWSILYGTSWVLLGIAIVNAGPGLQSGFSGWWAVFRGRRVAYPDMPTKGLFRISRQPIYVAFAATTWTTPTWTPDQLAVALGLTGYCLIGPGFKEARFRRLYGSRFEAYAERVPYWLPLPGQRRGAKKGGSGSQ